MNSKKPPFWYWIIAVITFIWNAMGVNAYLQQVYNTESYRAMYTKAQLEIDANLPVYIIAAFAIAVFAGILGGVFLILRKSIAVYLFYISLLAVIVQWGYMLFKGLQSNTVMALMILVFAILFAWFAKYSKIKGYLV